MWDLSASNYDVFGNVNVHVSWEWRRISHRTMYWRECFRSTNIRGVLTFLSLGSSATSLFRVLETCQMDLGFANARLVVFGEPEGRRVRFHQLWIDLNATLGRGWDFKAPRYYELRWFFLQLYATNLVIFLNMWDLITRIKLRCLRKCRRSCVLRK